MSLSQLELIQELPRYTLVENPDFERLIKNTTLSIIKDTGIVNRELSFLRKKYYGDLNEQKQKKKELKSNFKYDIAESKYLLDLAKADIAEGYLTDHLITYLLSLEGLKAEEYKSRLGDAASIISSYKPHKKIHKILTGNELDSDYKTKLEDINSSIDFYKEYCTTDFSSVLKRNAKEAYLTLKAFNGCVDILDEDKIKVTTFKILKQMFFWNDFRKRLLSIDSIAGLNFDGVSFVGYQLNDVKFQNCSLLECNFNGCFFGGNYVYDSTFPNARMNSKTRMPNGKLCSKEIAESLGAIWVED